MPEEICEQLGRSSQDILPNIKRQNDLTKCLAGLLLREINRPTVIAFDEMDRILGRTYQEDFFSMLRLWHNLRADSAMAWPKVGLAIAISTEPFLFITDVLRSPFNVGLNIELRAFNETECQRLARHYGARLTPDEFRKLMQLLKGHPHLTHMAFFALTGPSPIDFRTLLRVACSKSGPFGSHLRALEFKLLDDPGQTVVRAMKLLIKNRNVSKKDAYRLQSAGLAREDGNRLVPANELYLRFFQDF